MPGLDELATTTTDNYSGRTADNVRKGGRTMAKLTASARNHIAKKNFALPGGRYPIEDENHARAALSRVSANGTPEEKAAVRAKVHAKYPGMGDDKDGGRRKRSAKKLDDVIGGAITKYRKDLA